MHVTLSNFGFKTDTSLTFSHGAFTLTLWLFQKLLVWSNQGPMNGVCSLLPIDHARLIVLLHSVQLASILAASDS